MDDATQPDTTTSDAVRRAPSRRAVLGAAAWAAPVVVVASATPALAASGGAGESLTRTSPAAALFSADQQAFSQGLSVTLTDNGTGVPGREVTFSVVGTESTAWLTFAPATVTTDAGGVGTTLLQYGAPKPTAGATYTVTATSGSLSTSWTLTYEPTALPDVLVVRLGTGSAALTNASTAVFLDRYAATATSASAPASSIALPTAATSGNNPLTTSGSATSEGLLSRSPSGAYVALAGYAAAPGVAGIASTGAGTASGQYVRVVGRVDGAGSVDTTTTLGAGAYSANNVRSAALSSTGDDLWAAGANDGIRYAARGASSSTVVSATVTNNRAVEVYGDSLYFSTASGTSRGIYRVGAGTPPTSGTTAATLVVDTGSNSSPYEFVFLDRSGAVAGNDTVYVADDAAGVRKFSLVNGTWTANGSFLGTGSGGYRGLTGAIDPQGNVTLFATTNTGTTLVRIVDTAAFNQTIAATTSTVRTIATNTAHRGVAFAPTA